MRKVGLLLVLSALVALVVPNYTFAAESFDAHKLEGKSHDLVCKATFHERRFPKSSPVGRHFPSVWGSNAATDDTRGSVTLVSEVEIRVRKTDVHVPPSAYLDLASINMVECKRSATENEYVVNFGGGVGRSSYFGSFLIRNGVLIKRRVGHGESPDRHEMTDYFYPEDDESL